MTTNSKMLPKDDWYRKYYWDLRKNAWNCSRCSNCKWVDSWEVKSARFAKICPSIFYYLFDAYSCQGRMDNALALIDGKLKYSDSQALLDVFNACNFCGACDVMCKRVQDMEPLRVMQEIRFRLVSDGHLTLGHQAIIEHLRKEDNMMMLPRKSRGQWAAGLGLKDLTHEKAEIVFHAGCHSSMDKSQWPTLRSAVGILQKAGLDVGIMGSEEVCCGGRAYEMGYKGEFIKYAQSNMEAWTAAGVKTVVTPCSDGYYAFKRLYPEIGAKFEVLHMVELIASLAKRRVLRFTRAIPSTVTCHDPCHLGRRSHVYIPGEAITGVYEAPREIIRSIPGVNLVEMERIKEFAWCCGAGGGVLEAYPELNAFTANERIEEARATGASLLVTACPWCERNFNDASKGELQVLDIVGLVQMAIGG